MRIEAGSHLLTPSGIEYSGFKITFDHKPQPERTYEDIEHILRQNSVPFLTHEERTSGGTFKSYSVIAGTADSI